MFRSNIFREHFYLVETNILFRQAHVCVGVFVCFGWQTLYGQTFYFGVRVSTLSVTGVFCHGEPTLVSCPSHLVRRCSVDSLTSEHPT